MHKIDEMKHVVTKVDGITHIKIEPGNLVFCDDCGKDFTDSTESGGLMFGSKAVCPRCAPKWDANAVKFGEQSHIHGRCPAGKSFADWVRQDLRE